MSHDNSAVFAEACRLPAVQHVRELFAAAPWLLSGENRDCRIVGCLNLTWGDLDLLTRGYGEIPRKESK